MPKSNLPDLLPSMVADVLSALGIPGTNTVGKIYSRYEKRRVEMARDILVEELRAAQITELDFAAKDDIVAFLVRFRRAALEGAARLNLRLMAKAIAGQVQHGAIYADEFSQFKEILASLTQDEVILLVAMHKIRKAYDKEKASGREVERSPWGRATETLVPSPYPSEEALSAAATRLTRTGLLIPDPTWDGNSGYQTSPLMDEIEALVDFQDVLKREQEWR